ncbi:MAG TPA: glycosyltransferase family 39 protein [Herpetosiphonaceae bacterium]
MAAVAHKAIPGAEVRTRSGLTAQRWLAVLIVALHVALALVWSVVVPLGEGPDEPAHMRYALFVAQRGGLPVQRAAPAESDVPGEGHQPPLAYWLLQPVVSWLPQEERLLEVGANPRSRLTGGDEPSLYFRSTRDTWPYRGVALAWHLARGVSAALGGVSVWLTYLTARRCFPGWRWLALGAAAIVAFNPQFIFAHALVSNDPLLIALASGLVYISIVFVTARPGDQADARRRMAWTIAAGVVIGLTLITKQSALAFAPLPLLALALRRAGIARWLRDSALVMGLAAALSGWWYARNQRLYGDWLGLDSFQQTFAPGGIGEFTWKGWTGGLWGLLRSSWGTFGWLTLPMNDGAYWAFAAFLALAGIGLVASAGRGWWSGRAGSALLLTSAAALAFAWTVAFARVAGAVAWQGRFLFPVIPALAVLLACGLGAVLPGRSALWTLIGLLLALAVALPRGLIAPAYPSYVLPPQPAQTGNIYGRFDLGWKRGVELRNVEVPREVFAGDTITVTLTWHALEQMERPRTVFLHVVDDREQIVAERNAQPLDGLFPINGWVRGDWIRDPKAIVLAGVVPGTYRLEIGIWDETTGERLGVYDRDGELFGDRVDAGPIVVRERPPGR